MFTSRVYTKLNYAFCIMIYYEGGKKSYLTEGWMMGLLKLIFNMWRFLFIQLGWRGYVFIYWRYQYHDGKLIGFDFYLLKIVIHLNN